MSKRQGIVRPLGLALVLAIGLAAVLALAATWGIAIWQGLRPSRVVSETLFILPDDTPVINRYVSDAWPNVTYRDLNGKELPPATGENSSLGGVLLLMPHRDGLIPFAGDLRIGRFYERGLPPNYWYFLHDGACDGRGYFVGYSYRSKLRVGFIGRDGLRPDQPPAEQWFPIDGAKMAMRTAMLGYGFGDYDADFGFSGWGTVMMISGAQLLEVNLRSGSVRTLMESPDLSALGMLATLPNGKAAYDGPAAAIRSYGEVPRVRLVHHLLVRTRDRVIVFGASEKQRTAFTIPESFRDQKIRLYQLDAGKALLTAWRNLPDGGQRVDLAWVDASGGVRRQVAVPLKNSNGRSEASATWTKALAWPAPVMLAFFSTVEGPLSQVEIGVDRTYSAALARSLAAWWPPLLAVTLLAAVLAWYCWRRHRRYYQPASAVWFVFVLLTGVPGLVAYLCHRRWPVLEKCSACGQVVPRDREACACCGAAFPAPEPKGCEVFA
ncbi:MAG: hypothetical protein ACLQLG_09290 [Thermoguttaceae bacterium]